MNLNDPSHFNDTIRYDIWLLAYNLTSDEKAQLTKLNNTKYKCCYSHTGPDVSFFYKYFTDDKFVAYRFIEVNSDKRFNDGDYMTEITDTAMN